jgi:hypothetical protein
LYERLRTAETSKIINLLYHGFGVRGYQFGRPEFAGVNRVVGPPEAGVASRFDQQSVGAFGARLGETAFSWHAPALIGKMIGNKMSYMARFGQNGPNGLSEAVGSRRNNLIAGCHGRLVRPCFFHAAGRHAAGDTRILQLAAKGGVGGESMIV